MTNECNLGVKWTTEQIESVTKALADLRLLIDLELAPRYPHFNHKPYPLGRCKEIRDAVFTLLQEKLPQSTEPGLTFIRDTLASGETLKKVWGSLRNDYFQNAILVGDWYIDVSNDTVNPNKPRVEIVAFAESGFSDISSFEQFVKIAEPYWEVKVYRNDICPALAPFMPLLFVADNGACWLGEANDDMLAVAVNSQFSASESILSALPSPPHDAIEAWKAALLRLKHNTFLHQQGNALDYCKEYRVNQLYKGTAFRDSAVMAYLSLPKGIYLK
jgi:hypothetical protein